MKFDCLHAILLIACMGLAFNVGMLLAEKENARWAPNPNAMQEACQKNPQMLVCQLPQKDAK